MATLETFAEQEDAGIATPWSVVRAFLNQVASRPCHISHHLEYRRRCSTGATLAAMARHISQRELRNDSGRIMRALDRGERFIVTRNGVPIGELQPIRKQFVRTDTLVAAFRGAPPLDPKRFRRDVDRFVNQEIKPRA
jgi:antitoxin (DNA-binding transcriptional repressor) of toxin-antitoxin stability system